jgi:tRNA 2-thiouridine synthesizing protein E
MITTPLHEIHSAHFDESGLLLNPREWDEELAQAIAYREGVGPLTDAHWRIIYALRTHYAQFAVAPAISHVCLTEGMQRFCAHDLFHSCLTAWKVAGLPDPGEEARAYLNDM